MRTVTTVTKVYTFDELSEAAKQKVLEDFAEFQVSYEWWKSVYDDAARCGLKITSFDIDRGNIEAEETEYPIDTAKLKKEYLSILKKEYEYLTSKESLIETIKANEYEFTAVGKQF